LLVSFAAAVPVAGREDVDGADVDVVTGVGVLAGASGAATTGCDADGRGVDSGLGAAVRCAVDCVVTGASGVGASAPVVSAVGDLDALEDVEDVSDVDDGAEADLLTGASAIRGAASLRGPAGGSSGVGIVAAAENAGADSAAASIVTHAATRILPCRSVCRRDDIPVDIRPSLFR
jgi:hypothetical protein